MNKEVILIIGASSDIGYELIQQVSQENTIIFAHYNSNGDRLVTLKKEVKGEIVPVQANLSNEHEVDLLIQIITNQHVHPNKIVFLAAPRFTLTRFKDVLWSNFKDQLDVQLFASFKILNAFLPKMAISKYGKVVFMLSSYTSGIPPIAMSHYVTAKYALLGLMKSLSSEFASKGICINSVSPSMIETSFLNGLPEKLIAMNADQHPLKRNAVVTDIVPAINFLLSGDSNYITGTNMYITGGA